MCIVDPDTEQWYDAIYSQIAIFQMYNDRFECFVDLDNDTVVPDGAKLKLVVLDSPRTEAAEPYAFLLHYVSKCLCI